MSAIHGRWCNAITWPTTCPDCRESVFFFRCDCGSGVFFDDLGHPWPIHDCDASWARGLRRRQDDSGGITVQLTREITVARPPDGTIDTTVVSRARRSQSQQDPIVAIKPRGSEEVTLVGILRELQVEVDVRGSLKLPDTSMVSGFLGRLARGKWGRVTIHTQSPHEDVINSYTAWVPSHALSGPVVSRGVTVAARVTSQSVPGVGNFWICSSYEVVGSR